MQKKGIDRTSIVQIRLRGSLPGLWSDWFDGMAIQVDAEGLTSLTGPVIDEAELYGLIDKVRDLGLQLISVTRLE